MLTGGPQTLEGRITGAGEAARLYEEIVRRLSDPALLRSLGDDLYEIRAFPVPNGEWRQVHFTVTTPLLASSETVQVEIPWARMSPTPAAAVVSGQINVSWDVRSAIAPTYNLDLQRSDAGRLSLGWEAPQGWQAKTDFTLYLSGGEGLLDTQLLPYRIPGDDGFFALLLAPVIDPSNRVARDVILVLDTSGSMRNDDKLAQAQEAARYVLNRLDPEDRFGIVSYATNVRLFGDGLHDASQANEGIEFVNTREAVGSTNISGALQLAFDLAEGDRPATILFLTDGLPTTGLSEPGAILNAARNANPGRTQLFAFGVGYDVNTILLDSLTREFVGTSHYITPNERIELEVGSLYEQISSPVLTDVQVDIIGSDITSIAPAAVTGIFAGTQTLITGRYGEAGPITVQIRGNSDSGRETFTYELELPERATADASIAQLWAQQRIADLITEIRLEGSRDSLIREIVEISTRFGIVTPFTSFIAEEPMQVFSRGGIDDVEKEADEAAASLAESESGVAAAQAADASSSLREGDLPAGPASPILQVVGANSYTLVDDAWLQNGYVLGTDTELVLVGSSQFGDLIATQPDLAEAATLGAEVVARGPDGFVRIVWPDPDSVDSVFLPPIERDSPDIVTPDDSTTTTTGPTSMTDLDPTPDAVEPDVVQPIDGTSPTPAALGDGDGGSATALWIGISLLVTALVALVGWRVERSLRQKA